jgi:hypothetical protein
MGYRQAYKLYNQKKAVRKRMWILWAHEFYG